MTMVAAKRAGLAALLLWTASWASSSSQVFARSPDGGVPALVSPAERASRGSDETSPFRAWFEAQLAHPTELPRRVQEVAGRYRYVFVAGFLNESFQSVYFRDNVSALLDAGVPAEAIHLLFPKSREAVEVSAPELGRALSELAAKGPEKLVVVGHSKGAVETLLFVQASPAFVRERVQAVFLVQGALGGSGVADFVLGQGHPLDERLSRASRAELTVALRGGRLLDHRLHGGLDSLTHRHAAALWVDKTSPSGSPVFFIRSHRGSGSVCKVLSVTARYLDAYYGENDGLVEVKDQWVPGAGTVLATLDADHTALTVAKPVSNQEEAMRRVFTRALLMQLAGALAP